MKKVKGIVFESTPREVILLCVGGEYRRLPARGRLYPLGVELEIAPSLLPAKLTAVAAAVILLFSSAALLWQLGTARPAAYFALDINPSILLLLNTDAAVLDLEAYNREGEILKDALNLENLPVDTALQLILQESYRRGYLAAGRENIVLLSLAAPPRYIISETALQQLAAQQLYHLEVNAYLRVSAAAPRAARAARQQHVSLNVILLADKIAALEPPPAQDRQKQLPAVAVTTATSVRELLAEVRPQHIFKDNEFIAGEKRGRDSKVNRPGPPPGFTPPGQANTHDAEVRAGAVTQPEGDKGQEGQDPPAVTPPGLVMEREEDKARERNQRPQEMPGAPADRPGEKDAGPPAGDAPPAGR